MPTSPQHLVASRRACRRLTRESGSNFPVAFCLLPAAKRQAMHALYAFMRHSDDLADGPRLASAHPGGDPAEALRHWRAALVQTIEAIKGTGTFCAQHPSGRSGKMYLSPLLPEPHGVDPRGRAILPAVAQTLHDFHIPLQTLLAVLDGVEMDLSPRLYETFDELTVYCERVASAVGLACMHIWGFDGDAPIKGTVPICRNGPKGAAHKWGLSPLLHAAPASRCK